MESLRLKVQYRQIKVDLLKLDWHTEFTKMFYVLSQVIMHIILLCTGNKKAQLP